MACLPAITIGEPAPDSTASRSSPTFHRRAPLGVDLVDAITAADSRRERQHVTKERLRVVTEVTEPLLRENRGSSQFASVRLRVARPCSRCFEAAARCRARGLHAWLGMATNTNSSSMNVLSKIFLVIAIIGAVNWGLIGFFNWNLVDAIFGGGTAEETSGVSRLIYAVVGLSGLITLLMLPRLRMVDDPRLVDRPVLG
ncbi:MAG TPA: DUF378 domain-containing protein [Kofleriaceae bacterium]|nr:DUF378 domain-containing protein [Kofleriaceae bacterium]